LFEYSMDTIPNSAQKDLKSRFAEVLPEGIVGPVFIPESDSYTRFHANVCGFPLDMYAGSAYSVDSMPTE